MSQAQQQSKNEEKINFVFPTAGNLFYEKKEDFKFCKPHLLPIKSMTLEKLEKMQLESQKQMRENRKKTAADS